jgi:hypothetical protein
VFKESSANDGTIRNINEETGEPERITVCRETFTGINAEDFVAAGKVAIQNLPAGLQVEMQRIDDWNLEVKILGNAVNHTTADSINNLRFTFHDTAFTTGSAGDVINRDKTDISIDFVD